METPPDSDPLAVLVAWHAEARRAGARDADAMTLATATPDGRPSARIVLYKGLDQGRVAFATNYASRKGRELAANPRAALLFYWPEIMRQIRIEGSTERAPGAASDAYFGTRPRESQLSAWASPQTESIASRAELLARFAEVEARFRERSVERPPGWGLYWVTPISLELWSSAPHRLHDRFRYERRGESWVATRLAP